MGWAFAQQTMWVAVGDVHYAFDTQQIGKVPFADGTSFTAQGKTFAVSEVDSIYVTATQSYDNVVNVKYSGTTARIEVAGNIAKNLDVSTIGAHVTIIHDSTVNEEITYNLSGTSPDGSFTHDGDFKISLTLNALNLTSLSGPAIDMRTGKRIFVNLTAGTTSRLADAPGTHNACMIVNGHAEVRGDGNLVLTGNAKHAYSCDEYLEFKKTFNGTLTVANAVQDAFHINQYLELKHGSVVVTACGEDAVQIDKKKDLSKEYNGQFIMSGGSLVANVTGNGAKGIKCEGDVVVSGGTLTINHTGGPETDAEGDTKWPMCIKTDADVALGAVVMTLTAMGEGGRGISADSTFAVNSGTFIINSANYAMYAKKMFSIKGGKIYAVVNGDAIASATDLFVQGGTNVVYSTGAGRALSATNNFYLNGGFTLAVSRQVQLPASHTKSQAAMIYHGVVPAGTSMALNNIAGGNVLAFKQLRDYGSDSVNIIMSAAAITKGVQHTLYTGATINEALSNWQQFYYGGNVTTADGTPLPGASGITAVAPYALMGN